MSYENYRAVLKMGQREYRACVNRGEYPFLPVLDDILQGVVIQREENLGVVDIPAQLIVGTKNDARKSAFSRSFYPLLEEKSEFASKWIALCRAHLQEEGIRDPIQCYEFLNKYYVVEGHKRVSVLRAFHAVTISGQVTRIVPQRSNSREIQVYYEFLDFYAVTRVNFIQYNRIGLYDWLLHKLVGESDRPWQETQRRSFFADVTRFRTALKNTENIPASISQDEALLVYLDIYGYPYLQGRTPAELKSDLTAIQKELQASAGRSGVELLLDPPPPAPEKGILERIIHPTPKKIKAAFLHDKTAMDSYWTYAHEMGRTHLETVFGDQVETASYFNVLHDDMDARMAKLAEEGFNVIFTTTPRLIDGTVKAAAEYPDIKFLNCSLNIHHPIVRTYYGRMYEARFLTGVVAGAMAKNGRIGYLSNYPIYGMPATINAFALGASMVNPQAQVFLEWSTMKNRNYHAALRQQGVSVLSGQDMFTALRPNRDFGVYDLNSRPPKNVALSFWHWGRFYEKIIRSILDGSWKNDEDAVGGGQAINYWWGMSSGVIELSLSSYVPVQTRRLVQQLRQDIIDDRMRVFGGPLADQRGILRLQEGQYFTPEEIIGMDYLLHNVIGEIPDPADLTEEAQSLMRFQAIPRREEDTAP